jgi:CheY-like chemotaxis protein/DNA-directed RNA polymerase specialized sigma24 family protein
MPLAERIAPHVPHLRRFARLLTGSQAGGDAAVERALKAIAADPSIFPRLPPRVALYRFFLTTHARNRREPATAAPDLLGGTAARSLAALTPEGRQAFFLVSVEGFTQSETAQILGLPERRVATLIVESGAEIGRQIATDVLVIEDEPLIALDLKRMLEGLGHRVAVARTHQDALDAADVKRPGLVLADIRLADGSSGLDAVNDLLRCLTVPVVFVTAFPERLAAGRGPEPTFLIRKPFREEALAAVVSQVLFFDQQAKRRGARSASPTP